MSYKWLQKTSVMCATLGLSHDLHLKYSLTKPSHYAGSDDVNDVVGNTLQLQ